MMSDQKAKKRRKQWINFVNRTRAKWEPTKESRICSEHFAPDAFDRMYKDYLDRKGRFLVA